MGRQETDGRDETRVRLDKWLWAARFFKTRGLATDAIDGGHVHVNGVRPKPSRTLQAGDRLTIRKATVEFEVVVRALSDRRGPAKEAALLYEESEESRSRREQQAEQRRLLADGGGPDRRPDKKSRRQIIQFKGR